MPKKSAHQADTILHQNLPLVEVAEPWLLAQNTPMRDVFWAAVIPAVAATLAAAGVAARKRADV